MHYQKPFLPIKSPTHRNDTARRAAKEYQMRRAWLFIAAFILQAVARPVEEFICPDSNKQNCYPKLFKPTTEWQIVREGQEIPGGLHVRMDMETNLKSAKLLDEADAGSSSDLQVVGSGSTDGSQQVIAHKPNGKLPLAEKNEFAASLQVLDSFSKDASSARLEDVMRALKSLEELSHDIDFGIRLSEPASFPTVLKMAELLPSEHLHQSRLSAQDAESVRDFSLRIIASALRNNPVALKNALNGDQSPSFVLNAALDAVSQADSKTIQKRLLGVISGYIQDNTGADLFRLNDGQNKILIAFQKFSADTQLRALQILDDTTNRSLAKRDDSSEADEIQTQDDIDQKYFSILKDKVIKDPDHADFKKLFIQLVKLKQASSAPIKVDSQFLNWLVDEIERRKNTTELVKRDNEDTEHGSDQSFSEYMLKARHVVFGNPLGYRKAFAADEL